MVTSVASAVSNCNTHKCSIARRQERIIRSFAMSIAKHLMWFTSLNFIKTFSHCFHIVYKLVYIYLNYTCKVLRNSHLQCRGCVWVHIIVTDRTNTHEWSLVCSYKAKLSTHLISFTSGILNIIPPLIPVPFFFIYNVHSEGQSWT